MTQQLYFWVFIRRTLIRHTNSERYTHPYVHCSIIYNSHAVDATQVSINGQLDKEEVVHIYNGYYPAIK